MPNVAASAKYAARLSSAAAAGMLTSVKMRPCTAIMADCMVWDLMSLPLRPKMIQLDHKALMASQSPEEAMSKCPENIQGIDEGPGPVPSDFPAFHTGSKHSFIASNLVVIALHDSIPMRDLRSKWKVAQAYPSVLVAKVSRMRCTGRHWLEQNFMTAKYLYTT